MKRTVPSNTANLDLSIFKSPKWFKDALCKGLAFIELAIVNECFFPTSYTRHGTNEPTPAVAFAKSICAMCPVEDECRLWAIQTNQSDGIWGGLGPEERKRYKRNAKIRERYREERNAA